ncbi:hypothetical protein ACJRO7_020237 [Eucalyptus globulus]|uniref:Pectinesterase inhibitor domain-containing protein n=1 Tax=Eucalyptus globulus TaxID=34317 RepID=A0ABD3KMR1_EUCGL
MNHTFSISSLFLIHFLILFPHVRSANDIVRDTCKKIASDRPNFKFDFCVKSLEADPEGHKVDVEGLGLIGLKLLQANITGTTEYIKQLLKKKWEQRLLKALSLCLEYYALVEGEDYTPLYKAKRYHEVNIRVSGVLTNEDSCDTQESRKGGMVPLLTKHNDDISQLSTIVLFITASFLGGE